MWTVLLPTSCLWKNRSNNGHGRFPGLQTLPEPGWEGWSLWFGDCLNEGACDQTRPSLETEAYALSGGAIDLDRDRELAEKRGLHSVRSCVDESTTLQYSSFKRICVQMSVADILSPTMPYSTYCCSPSSVFRCRARGSAVSNTGYRSL